MNVAERLNALYRASHIPLAFLAAEAGIPQPRLERVVEEGATPTTVELVQVCNALGVRVADLRGDPAAALPPAFRMRGGDNDDVFEDYETLRQILWAQRMVREWFWVRARLDEAKSAGASLPDQVSDLIWDRVRTRRIELAQKVTPDSTPEALATAVRAVLVGHCKPGDSVDMRAVALLMGAFTIGVGLHAPGVKSRNSTSIDGFFFREGDASVIVVNMYARPRNHYSFVVGHELYHILFDEPRENEVLIRAGRPHREDARTIEERADEFADWLLLPRQAVTPYRERLADGLRVWYERYGCARHVIARQLRNVFGQIPDEFVKEWRALMAAQALVGSQKKARGLRVPQGFKRDLDEAVRIGIISAERRDQLTNPKP